MMEKLGILVAFAVFLESVSAASVSTTNIFSMSSVLVSAKQFLKYSFEESMNIC